MAVRNFFNNLAGNDEPHACAFAQLQQFLKVLDTKQALRVKLPGNAPVQGVWQASSKKSNKEWADRRGRKGIIGYSGSRATLDIGLEPT